MFTGTLDLELSTADRLSYVSPPLTPLTDLSNDPKDNPLERLMVDLMIPKEENARLFYRVRPMGRRPIYPGMETEQSSSFDIQTAILLPGVSLTLGCGSMCAQSHSDVVSIQRADHISVLEPFGAKSVLRPGMEPDVMALDEFAKETRDLDKELGNWRCHPGVEDTSPFCATAAARIEKLARMFDGFESHEGLIALKRKAEERVSGHEAFLRLVDPSKGSDGHVLSLPPFRSRLGSVLNQMSVELYDNAGIRGVQPILWFLHRYGKIVTGRGLEVAALAVGLENATGYADAFESVAYSGERDAL